MKKIVLIFLFLGILVGLWYFGKSYVASKDLSNQEPLATSTPAQTQSTEAKSIDGKLTFFMKVRPQSEKLSSYNFSIDNGEKEYTVFSIGATPDSFVMPQNSWSPDGTYVFLIEKTTIPSVYVFQASGESFGEEQNYLNVTDLFTQKFPEKRLAKATGWDSRGLLHIRSQNSDNTQGPSYWFDVDSRTFIQLAAR